MKISLNLAAEKTWTLKDSFLANVQKFGYFVFDALFLLRIGRVRAFSVARS